MPTYVYECPVHGRKEVRKTMKQAGDPVYCKPCLYARIEETARAESYRDQTPDQYIDSIWNAVGPMRRVWSVPSLIVRPHGYHLRSDEPGYWDIDRAAEVSRIPSPDAKSNLGAGAPDDAELEADEYAGVPIPQPTDEGMQKLYEVARATFSESGSRL